MKTNILKKDLLIDLKNKISTENYSKQDVWLEDFFGDDWRQGSTNLISFNTQIELTIDGEGEKGDFTNIKKIHSALKHVDPSLLSEECFWSYLSHTIFYSYMIKRWEKTEKSTIQQHYFFSGGLGNSRRLLKNGISRLWFIGHLTYDGTRNDPYELTQYCSPDVISMIFERPALGSNRNFSDAILELIKDKEITTKRSGNFRELMKYFTKISGLVRLDSLEKDEIKDMARERVKNMINSDDN